MNKRNIDFAPKTRLPEELIKKPPEVIVRPVVKKDERYLYITDICNILGCGRNTAYKVIEMLNEKQPDHGMSEPPGRISKEFFINHFYGMNPRKEQEYGAISN